MVTGILLLGIIILVGVIGKLFFERTRIPESLFLIATGILLGPVLNLVSQEAITANLDLFITFALVIVLLNSGLNLDIRGAMRTMRDAMLFTGAVFISSVIVTSAALHLIFDWPILHGIFLGIIVSGTTTVTITHLVERMGASSRVRKSTKDILIFESVINDVSVIAGASILVALVAPGAVTGQSIAQTLFNEAIVSSLLGAALGMLWIIAHAYRLHENPLAYIFTVGIALSIYALSEFLGLNGAITLIVFAVTIGNHELSLAKVHHKFDLRGIRGALTRMRATDLEFTFLIRTFFFFMLGAIFTPAILQDWRLLALVGVVLCSKFVARAIASVTLGIWNKSFRHDHLVRTVVVANGFTSTLAAFLAVEAGIAVPHIAEIVLLLVISTTVTAIAGTVVHHHLDKN